MVAPELAPDTHPTTVAPYVTPPMDVPRFVPAPPSIPSYTPPRIAPPTTAPADPFILNGPMVSDGTPLPKLTGAYGPSIGYGYAPPAPGAKHIPVSASDTSPTTLPTVTTWGERLSTNHYRGAFLALAVIVLLIVAYRRWRG